ncbi:hypothetical protein KIH74_34820 [Kineosporia sp. J2-2]|uniref:Uncharacterized protein n=1 Tax=Kineosporia corallincola TaxID=2835133 RepID=A0ABS5TTP2_9ACTN|nr:hypothetical protein [Kineosporia corallincola]MBT0774171.1 hypothetical protein [Kineosporia corallincola]
MNRQALMQTYFARQEQEIAAQQQQASWPAWRDRYTWKRRTPAPSEPAAVSDEHDGEVWTSFSTLESGYDLQPPHGFQLKEAWSNGYRMVWTSLEDLVVLTYCEGDLTYQSCTSRETFSSALREHGRSYRNMRR